MTAILEPPTTGTDADLTALFGEKTCNTLLQVSEEAAPAEERFTINSRDRADWYLKKLRGIEGEIETVKAQAAEMIRALEAERNRLQARHEADLQAWARSEMEAKGGRTKTLRLFQGSVCFRTVPASLRVCGTAEAIEHSKAAGWSCVGTVEKLDAEGYRQQAAAVLHETGEILPGVEVVAERESFSVRFPKPGKGGTDTAEE